VPSEFVPAVLPWTRPVGSSTRPAIASGILDTSWTSTKPATSSSTTSRTGRVARRRSSGSGSLPTRRGGGEVDPCRPGPPKGGSRERSIGRESSHAAARDPPRVGCGSHRGHRLPCLAGSPGRPGSGRAAAASLNAPCPSLGQLSN
jgi:hypothetical protein